MNDPYQVLGISRGASDDEIKKAYRAQCKRWHPDLNPNDPTAEEHFKQVQEAYDTIMKGGQTQQAQSGYNPYGYSQGYQQSYGQNADPFGFNDFFGGGYSQQNSYYGGQSSYQGTDTPQMQAARNFIANRRYPEARRVLDEIRDRNARWYYLSALANQGLGRRVDAMNDARRACQMDPQNAEYRSLYNRMQSPGGAYQQRSYEYGGSSGSGNLCFRFLMMNLLCNCCFGPGFCPGFFYCPGFYC